MRGFTDQGIQKLKPGNSKRTITEGGGLYLQISPRGQKTWYHRYESGGRRRWLKLGEYPAMSLKEARQENEKKAKITERGEDPAEMDNEDPTVREFFEAWTEKAVDKRGKPWSEAHKRNTTYMFKANVLPRIGGMKVRDVRKRDIRALLEKVEERAPNQALQLYRRMSRLFNLAAEKDIIEASPMANLPAIGTQGEKDRYLTADEVKTFLAGLPHADMAPNTAAILEIILRTGQRPSEVCGATETEMQGDWWIIPPARTKNGLEHRIFITPKVKALFGSANDHGLFFPSLRDDTKPVAHTVLSKAIRRSTQGDEKTQKDKTPSLTLAPFSPHDLRRTCATHLGEAGFTDDIIGAVLNHKKRSVTGIYNRHAYDKEKRRALLAWERRLDEILTGKRHPKVVNIETANQ